MIKHCVTTCYAVVFVGIPVLFALRGLDLTQPQPISHMDIILCVFLHILYPTNPIIEDPMPLKELNNSFWNRRPSERCLLRGKIRKYLFISELHYTYSDFTPLIQQYWLMEIALINPASVHMFNICLPVGLYVETDELTLMNTIELCVYFILMYQFMCISDELSSFQLSALSSE